MFINRTKSALMLADKLSSCHCHNLCLRYQALFLPPTLSALFNVIIILAGVRAYYLKSYVYVAILHFLQHCTAVVLKDKL